jgi:hypothetical protein
MPSHLRHRTTAGRSRPAAQVQVLPNPATTETAARYFRAGHAKQAAAVERVFEQSQLSQGLVGSSAIATGTP